MDDSFVASKERRMSESLNEEFMKKCLTIQLVRDGMSVQEARETVDYMIKNCPVVDYHKDEEEE